MLTPWQFRCYWIPELRLQWKWSFSNFHFLHHCKEKSSNKSLHYQIEETLAYWNFHYIRLLLILRFITLREAFAKKTEFYEITSQNSDPSLPYWLYESLFWILIVFLSICIFLNKRYEIQLTPPPARLWDYFIKFCFFGECFPNGDDDSNGDNDGVDDDDSVLGSNRLACAVR